MRKGVKERGRAKVLFNTGTSAVGATVGLKLRKKPAPVSPPPEGCPHNRFGSTLF